MVVLTSAPCALGSKLDHHAAQLERTLAPKHLWVGAQDKQCTNRAVGFTNSSTSYMRAVTMVVAPVASRGGSMDAS